MVNGEEGSFYFSSPESMKSGGGVEVTTVKVKSICSSRFSKRPFRLPFALLFLVAVATFFSCRTAVRRCVTYRKPDNSLISLLSSKTPSSSYAWNATLLRLASVDVNEKEYRAEIEGLLESNGAWNHRSIASWRRYSHQIGALRSYTRSKRLAGVRERDGVHVRLNPTRLSRFFPDFRRNLRHWSRNRRFHPGVVSELLELVKPLTGSHHSDKSETQSKFKTCAVVGNSGILLKHDNGALIDGHDVVIRLNNARTHGYHRNVGNRTSLAFINSNIFHLCARREQCYCHPYGPDVPILMYICQAVHIMDYTICNATQNSPLLITNLHFDLLCSRIVKYYSLKRFVKETGKLPEEWDKVHDAKVFHYSSGMQAVMLALGICDQVSIFGFGKSMDAKHHYHTNQKVELSLHDYKAEYAFYQDLIERPQVIPFLADVGFTVPTVVIYH